jgi:hypothetical protein
MGFLGSAYSYQKFSFLFAADAGAFHQHCRRVWENSHSLGAFY